MTKLRSLIAKVGERGQVAMIAAGLLPVLLGMTGLAVDVGSYMSERRQLQNAADSIALAGAQELPDEDAARDEPERTGFFGRLRDSLAKSRRALTAEIAAGTFDAADEEAWERLEEALIHGDVGVRATAELVRRLEAREPQSQRTESAVEHPYFSVERGRPHARKGPSFHQPNFYY